MTNPAASFIDRLGSNTEADGLSPIAGRLFGALILSSEPRSLDELAESLGVSKASISTEARRLLERNVVERLSKPGDRRDYYQLTPDFYAQLLKARMARWRRFQELARGVRSASPDLPPTVRDRLDSIDDIQTFVIERIEKALAEWEAREPAQHT